MSEENRPYVARAIREHREAIGMTQGDLAAAAGVDKRQIRRYEAGDTQPVFSVAVAIAKALRVSLDDLSGDHVHRVDLTGDWWVSWETFRNGNEVITSQRIRIHQRGEVAEVSAISRGLSIEQGGYLWRGEMQLWDNEILLGWYAANEATVRSKGVTYFVIHPHGINMTGRWVGLSYDGMIVTGFGAIARSEQESITLLKQLIEKGAPPS